MTAMLTAQPTADDVRAFAQKRGIPVKDKGRLSLAAIEAYNKVRKPENHYVPTWDQPLPLLSIKGRKLDAAGRPRSVTLRATAPEIREWARKNGFPELPVRGRLPQAVFDAYGMKDMPKAKGRKASTKATRGTASAEGSRKGRVTVAA